MASMPTWYVAGFETVKGLRVWLPSVACHQAPSLRWTEAFYSFSYTGYQTGGIAFSRTSVSFTEVNAYTGRTVTVDANGLAPSSVAVRSETARAPTSTSIWRTSVPSGKGLNPSTNPTCAALSCMTPYVTSAKLAIVFQGQVVPEAKPMGMLAGGLAVLSLAGWRRRAQKYNQPTDCEATSP